MFRGIFLLTSSLFVATTAHVNNVYVDGETFDLVSSEVDAEIAKARTLIGFEADGELGSRCGVFNECNLGYECWHNRCIPHKDCLRQKMEDFSMGFDEDGYRAMLYQKSGVTEQDIMLAYKEAKNDQAFVRSKTMQSLIATMQDNWEPLEPLSEIVDRCSGFIQVEDRKRKLEKVTLEMRDAEERRLQVTASPSAGPSVTPSSSPSAGPSETPSSTPSKSPSSSPSNSPSVSLAPSSSPSVSIAPSVTPSGTPSSSPSLSIAPSMTPSIPRTCYLGVHLEGGILFEISLSVFWKSGVTTSDTFVRGCAGFEIGGGIEFLSFIAIIAETPLDNGIACGSFLWENDIGFIFHLGFGLGVCFSPQPSFTYYEFTIGGGFGGGSGFNVCGVITVAAAADECEDGEECEPELLPVSDP